MWYFDGAGNLTDAQALEKVVHVKLDAEEVNVLQIRNDLSMTGDKLSLCVELVATSRRISSRMCFVPVGLEERR